MTELALILGLGVLGLVFAAYLARWVLAQHAGEGDMPRVAGLIRAAAETFSKRQSSTIGAVSAAFAGAIFLAYGLLRRAGDTDPVPALELGVWLTVSFAVGAASAVAVGQVGTWIATRASVRAASAARRSVDLALQLAVRGGAVSGLFIVSLSLLGMAGLFAGVLATKGGFGAEPAAALKLAPTVPIMIAGYALGASFAALLAQLGGGTFSKSADLGGDLGGREIGLGEDDPRNPATISDLAGDAVGDCAGRGAGLFASTCAEGLGAMIIGASLFRSNEGIKSALAVMLFPLVTRAFGVVGAMFGVMVVRTDDREDPLQALARGLYVSAVLHAVGVAGAAKWLLGVHWVPFVGCAAIGIALGVGLLHVTQYYTQHRHRPVRDLAEASRAGPSFTLLSGVGLGLESTVLPFVLVVVAAFGAHALGASTGLKVGGLYGIASAAMGLLGTSGYVLAMDALGPIVDAGGGIVEMTIARDRPDVRGRALVLDAVGNTAKALTKCHAAAAAALSSLLLVTAYLDEVRRRTGGTAAASFEIDRPELYVGAALGILLVGWVAARAVTGVARVAKRVVDEVKRQAKDQPPGFVPDHQACFEMLARAALRQMILPAVVGALTPIAVGLLLRFARGEDNPLIAANAVAALIMAGTIAGVLGSLLLGNAGGAWDNARKYIATGAHGGRYLVDETGARIDNPAYLSAIVGDAFGDPLKDTAGPAIHILVKMLPVVTLVFLPFFV